jgi:hypothetical protein
VAKAGESPLAIAHTLAPHKTGSPRPPCTLLETLVLTLALLAVSEIIHINREWYLPSLRIEGSDWLKCGTQISLGSVEDFEAAPSSPVTLEPWIVHKAGNRFIGCNAMRGGKMGKVVGYCPPDAEDAAMWHLVYLDEDREDLELHELEEAMLHAKAAEGKGDASTCKVKTTSKMGEDDDDDEAEEEAEEEELDGDDELERSDKAATGFKGVRETKYGKYEAKTPRGYVEAESETYIGVFNTGASISSSQARSFTLISCFGSYPGRASPARLHGQASQC